jgi:hypothetical protein
MTLTPERRAEIARLTVPSTDTPSWKYDRAIDDLLAALDAQAPVVRAAEAWGAAQHRHDEAFDRRARTAKGRHNYKAWRAAHDAVLHAMDDIEDCADALRAALAAAVDPSSRPPDTETSP